MTKTPNTLADQIAALDQKASRLEDLCGSMLATLKIQANQEHIHPRLQELATDWQNRYRVIIGKGPE